MSIENLDDRHLVRELKRVAELEVFHGLPSRAVEPYSSFDIAEHLISRIQADGIELHIDLDAARKVLAQYVGAVDVHKKNSQAVAEAVINQLSPHPWQ